MIELQEIQGLKDMNRELKETYKEDVKALPGLMKAIDEMTSREADTEAENRDTDRRLSKHSIAF